MFVLSLMPGASAVAAQAAPMAGNVVALTVKTPRGGFNRMVVSVTLCAPSTRRCATIDDVTVDTGSTGLRIEASAMSAALRLPAFPGPDGAPLAECLRFVHSAAWGPLVRADARLGGLTPGIPIQVIEDEPREQPAPCPVSNVRPTANGTLGVGPHLLDCQGYLRRGHEGAGRLQLSRWVMDALARGCATSGPSARVSAMLSRRT